MRRILGVLATAALVACASSSSPGPKVEQVEVTQVRARVTAIDHAKRLVTITGASGESRTFFADEAVKNLPQVKVGDELVGQSTESLAIEVREPTAEELATPTAIGEAVATAEPGQKPAGVYVRQLRALLEIVAIDKATQTVTLVGESQKPFSVKARDPKNLERVKVGDDVVVTYTETLALAVEGPGT